MATYIALIDYTDQGVRDIKDSPARSQLFRAQAEQMGVTIKGLYWCTGAHDGVLIIDAPDQEAAAALLLSLGAAGNVRTTTMRAYDGEEFASLLAKIH